MSGNVRVLDGDERDAYMEVLALVDAGLRIMSFDVLDDEPEAAGHAAAVVASILDAGGLLSGPITPSKYERALVDLCCHADSSNLVKLVAAFGPIPATVVLYKMTNGGLQRIRVAADGWITANRRTS